MLGKRVNGSEHRAVHSRAHLTPDFGRENRFQDFSKSLSSRLAPLSISFRSVEKMSHGDFLSSRFRPASKQYRDASQVWEEKWSLRTSNCPLRWSILVIFSPWKFEYFTEVKILFIFRCNFSALSSRRFCGLFHRLLIL